MAKLLKLRRGTDTQHSTFTGAEGEVTVNTTNDSLHVHDGTTAGGTELAKADLSNVDGSLSNNLGFGDSVKATFGTGNDLEIFHDGTHSYIKDVATGGLRITTDGPSIDLQKGISENIAKFIADGACELYHDASKKLATTSTGIDVTGTVACDGLTSDGQMRITLNDDPQLVIKDGNSTGDTVRSGIAFTDSADATQGRMGYITDATDDLYVYNDRAAQLVFGTSNADRVIVDANGHLLPANNNTYDLGTSSNQWRDAYFDGTVNTDNLTCDSSANFNHGAAGAVTIGANGDIRFTNGTWSGNTTSPKIQAHDNCLYILGGPGGIIFREDAYDRCLIDGDGHLRPAVNNTYDLGTSAARWNNIYTNGILFNGDNAAANKLDDYETGTWTPVLKYYYNGWNTVSFISGPSQTTGSYVKVGDMVHFSYYTGSFQVTSGVQGNQARIEGLPYAAYNAGGAYSTVTFAHCTAFQQTIYTGYIDIGNDALDPIQGNSTGRATWNGSTSRYLMVSGTYRAA